MARVAAAFLALTAQQGAWAEGAPRRVVHVPGWSLPPGVPLSAGTVTGGTIYVSGMSGFDMKTMKLVPGGVAAETRQALTNVREVVTAAGGSLEDIVGCSVMVTNLTRDFKTMNAEYATFWAKDPPSRVGVEVAALAGGASVEIQCNGMLPGRGRAVVNVTALPPLKGFPLSFAVKTRDMLDDMVYVSGLQGWDQKTMKLVPGGPAAETAQTMENVKSILRDAGSSLDNIVGCEVSLRNLSDFKAVNEAYASFWPQGGARGFPSRVAVQVADLSGGAAVEIRCTATAAGVRSEVIKVPEWAEMHGFPLSLGIATPNTIYVSGMLGMDMRTMKLVPGGVAAETRQALENVKAVLAARAARLEDVLICEVTLRDMRDFQAMNAVYRSFWPHEPPARVAVQAAGLAGGAAVEVKCTGAQSSAAEVLI